MELFSLSLAKDRPELFACGGTSPFALLHDRRFSRQIQAEWGVPAASRSLSHCVRKYTLPHCAKRSKHITALNISDDAKDLLVSYSDGPIACFDVFESTDQEDSEREMKTSKTEAAKAKRKRSGDNSVASKAHPNAKRRTTGQDDDLEELAGYDDEEDPESDGIFEPQLDSTDMHYSAEINNDGELDISRVLESEQLTSDLEERFSPTTMESAPNPMEVQAHDEDEEPVDGEESEELESDLDYDPLPLAFHRQRPDPCPDVPKVSKSKVNYTGHRNERTVKDVDFFLSSDKVVSGSDDGRFFIWDRKSGQLLNILLGDGDTVGCWLLRLLFGMFDWKGSGQCHSRPSYFACGGL